MSSQPGQACQAVNSQKVGSILFRFCSQQPESVPINGATSNAFPHSCMNATNYINKSWLSLTECSMACKQPACPQKITSLEVVAGSEAGLDAAEAAHLLGQVHLHASPHPPRVAAIQLLVIEGVQGQAAEKEASVQHRVQRLQPDGACEALMACCAARFFMEGLPVTCGGQQGNNPWGAGFIMGGCNSVIEAAGMRARRGSAVATVPISSY